MSPLRTATISPRPASSARLVMCSARMSDGTTMAACSGVSQYRSFSWPGLTIRPSFGPLRSARTFEVSVEVHRIRRTSSRKSVRLGNPKRLAAVSRLCIKETVTSCGVDSTLINIGSPLPLTKVSVIVPPVSTSTQYISWSPSSRWSRSQPAAGVARWLDRRSGCLVTIGQIFSGYYVRSIQIYWDIFV